MRDGARTAAGEASLDDARAHFQQQHARLPAQHRRLRNPDPYQIQLGPQLRRLIDQSR
jgi:hypothetical protein